MNTFELHPDNYPENPRTEWDNVGTMVCWNHRHNLGDIKPSLLPIAYLNTLPKGSVVMPLYLYDHSGITMSTTPFSCPWDSGRVGFIYMTPEKIRENFGINRITKKIREKCEAVMISEVETYDAYISGDVWIIVEEDENGEVVESTGGFYGFDEAKKEVKRMQEM